MLDYDGEIAVMERGIEHGIGSAMVINMADYGRQGMEIDGKGILE